MSNELTRRHTTPERLPEMILDAAGRATQASGCTCTVEVKVWHDEHGVHCTITHNPDCPAKAESR